MFAAGLLHVGPPGRFTLAAYQRYPLVSTRPTLVCSQAAEARVIREGDWYFEQRLAREDKNLGSNQAEIHQLTHVTRSFGKRSSSLDDNSSYARWASVGKRIIPRLLDMFYLIACIRGRDGIQDRGFTVFLERSM